MASRGDETTVAVDPTIPTQQPGIELRRLEDDDEDEEKLKFQNNIKDEEDSSGSNSPATSRRTPEQRPFFKKSVDKTVESPFVSNDLSNRWGALVCLAALNFACTLSWASVGAGAQYFNEFYGFNTAASWLSMVYTLLMIPAAIVTVALDLFFGVRCTCIGLSVLVAVSLFFRAPFEFLPFSPKAHFILQIISHSLTAIVYPGATILPLKFVLRWFPQDHKIFAAGATFLANLSAILVAGLLAGGYDNWNLLGETGVPYYNLFTGLLNFIIGFFSVIVLTKVLDKGAHPEEPCLVDDLKKFANKRALGVALAIASNLAVFNLILTMLHPILCSSLHERDFSSMALATFVIGGLSGILFAGLIVDFTKKQDECFRLGSGLCVLMQLLFFQLILHDKQNKLIFVVIAFVGEFLLGLVPLGLSVLSKRLNGSAETLPVAITVIAGQLLSVLYLMGMQKVSKELSPGKGNAVNASKICESYAPGFSVNAKDWTLSVMVVSVISTVILILLYVLDRKTKKKSTPEELQAQSAATQTNADEVETPLDTVIRTGKV
ncbi:unnamed protein product [Bursaphelenchus xylophilus]|uniref:(pine wood nematode) hypothetical protein n=1 Tax=Bursaphelenchus xylophilus TaxID=6326 RepID=A0A1I7RK64_BURXY|nr:unnamed protein product [Bursaphelenchus xylophilus]CAG9131473.1 unnamed protein product [Bursaphelenchus xylophilus]